MDTSTQVTEHNPVKSPTGAKPKRQYRPIEEKRRIVEATLAEGASVARVARAHGVNANQVFGWRRLYLAGRLGEQRINQVTDERNRISLPGNVHPMARPEFDDGSVADNQSLMRILLLLQRTPAQQ